MISRLSVLAVLIVFLAACSKTVEYTNIIPADATVVTSINLKSLASKAGLNDKENEAAKQKVLEALKSGMNAATFQQLEKVMNNPSESGIDVEAPVYVFTSPSFFHTLPQLRKSKAKMTCTLPWEIMVKEQICQPINEAAGYSFTTMTGRFSRFQQFCRNAHFRKRNISNRKSQRRHHQSVETNRQITALRNPALSRKWKNKKVTSISSLPWQLFLHLIKSKSVWDFPLK